MRVIAALATLLSVLCLATGASAHAVLVSTEPADGSIQAMAPKTVQLRFNEAVTPVVVAVIDAEGRTRDDATVRVVGEAVVVMLPDELPRGTQVVSYRVISEDGHPVAGAMVFSIGAVTGSAANPAGAGSVNGLIWLARIGVYLGLLVGVGGAFFACWIGRARTGSRLTIAALMLGLVSAVASLGLQGLDLQDLPPGNLLTAAPWKAAASTSLFQSLLIAAVAMTAGIVALQYEVAGAAARLLSAFALAGVGLSLASSGHAASASPQWLTRPAVFLHGAGAAFWVGALAPLAAMAWRRTQGLLAVLHRFSRAAVPSVGVLVLTGLVLAIVQLERLGALIHSQYGIILSIKVTLVAALLGLAALNRFRLTSALALDPQDRRLVRSILAECVIVVGILAVVAGWRFTPPPRALAAAAVTPLAIHIHTGKAMFQVQVSPGRVGSNSLVLQLMNGESSPLPAREATLTLNLPERGIQPLERKAVPGADGQWSVRDVPIPVAGRWHIRIDALVSDFERITLEDDFDVPPR